MKTITIEKLHDLVADAYAVCLNDSIYYVGYDNDDMPYVSDNDGYDQVSLAKVDGDIEVAPFGLFFSINGTPINLRLLSLMNID
jgi:hypothetical protein